MCSIWTTATSEYAWRRDCETCAEDPSPNRPVRKAVELLVVLLPTKDTVFWPHTNLREGGLPQLVANEARLKQELISDLNSQRIHVVDATDATS